MSLLDKLKSLLGLGGSSEENEEQRDVEVTVERESGRETDASTERAVKSSPPDEETEDGETADSPGEAATNGTPPQSGAQEDGSDEEKDDRESSRVPSEAVDVIKGIGPTYAGRLSDAGVETVDDLAGADPDSLSEEADVPKGRVENWIEQAEARSR